MSDETVSARRGVDKHLMPAPANIEAVQDEWLDIVEEYGGSARAAARALGVNERTIRDRVAKARKRHGRMETEDATGYPRNGALPREPQLEPLFPQGDFSRQRVIRTRSEVSLLADQRHVVQIEERAVTLECGHAGAIRRGSRFVCMVCHQSGKDKHPALERNPATDPKPDPKPESGQARAKNAKLTRRQKRKISQDPRMN